VILIRGAEIDPNARNAANARIVENEEIARIVGAVDKIKAGKTTAMNPAADHPIRRTRRKPGNAQRRRPKHSAPNEGKRRPRRTPLPPRGDGGDGDLASKRPGTSHQTGLT
jgi:hypothetical protein